VVVVLVVVVTVCVVVVVLVLLVVVTVVEVVVVKSQLFTNSTVSHGGSAAGVNVSVNWFHPPAAPASTVLRSVCPGCLIIISGARWPPYPAVRYARTEIVVETLEIPGTNIHVRFFSRTTALTEPS